MTRVNGKRAMTAGMTNSRAPGHESLRAAHVVSFADLFASKLAPGLGGVGKRWLCAVLFPSLLVSAFWAWGQGLSGPYQFDDYVTPLNDPASQSLAAWQAYLPVTLRPATKLSYALEAEAGLNSDPAARRIVSIAMLLISALLLALLAALLAPVTGPSATTTIAAGFVCLLWLVHPVHADAVLLISGRTALLSGLFLLAALLALESRRPWLAGAVFLLACLARETAVAGLLPLAVLAVSRPAAAWRSAVRELLPSLLAAVFALAWILSTPRYLALAEFSFLGRPFWSSLAAQVGAIPVGLSLLLQPGGMSIDYGLPLPHHPFEPLAILGAGLYLAAIAGMLLAIRHSRVMAVGLAIWLAAILPTQSLIPKLDPLSNRPLSLALAGLLLAAVPLVTWLLRRIEGSPQKPALAAILICGAALLAVTASMTAQRARLFSSELLLWQDAASKSLTNSRPHLQYAKLLLSEGDAEVARQELATAQRIDPFNSRLARLVRAYPQIEASQ